MSSSRFTARAIAALVGALAFVTLACSPPPGAQDTARDDDSPVVATIDGQPITQDELDDWIRDQLFEQQVGSKGAAQQYEARSQALKELVSQRVLEAAAEREGLTSTALVEKQVEELGPVTDEEVAAFFEEHKQRFRPPNNTLESRAGQIRSFLESQRQQKATEAITSAAVVEVQLEAPRIDVAAIGPSIGPDDAPVTIVEFSDYQCPFCSRAEPTIKRLLDRYGSQIRVVYRHYPLDRIHPRARPAAEAAVCVQEQGRYWDFHERLFANQRALEDADLEQYASDLGIDMAAYAACLEKPETKARVQADTEAAERAGVSGTPAFFVNGIMLSGARSEDDFAAIIDSELAARAGGGEDS